jgi:hypothetical protein
MSLLETEHVRRKKKRARRKKKPSGYHYTLDAPLSASHPDQVLTFHEWCRLNRISESTGRRILAGGNGPIITQLANWRVGVTVGNNALWQRSRERASNDTQPRRRGRPQAQERA